MDERTSLLQDDNRPIRPTIEHAETRGSEFEPTINCQVCSAVVPIGNKEKQLVVKCQVCSEATPIKGPPPGKQYVRCPCNCLLICKASTTRVGCPRPQCQRVITLSNADTENYNATNTTEGNGPAAFQSRGAALRVTCGNCHRPFSIPSQAYQPTRCDSAFVNRVISCLSGGSAANASLLIAARCPQCRKVTSVGQAYARVNWLGFFILFLIFLSISVIVSAATSMAATSQHGLYFLWSLLYLATLFFAIRAVMFFRMPVSALELVVTRA